MSVTLKQLTEEAASLSPAENQKLFGELAQAVEAYIQQVKEGFALHLKETVIQSIQKIASQQLKPLAENYSGPDLIPALPLQRQPQIIYLILDSPPSLN